MHAVIRILAFLIFALFVAFGSYPELLFSVIIIISVYVANKSFTGVWQTNWQMLKRMRWLFLSLLIVYLWFTPGVLIFPGMSDFSPTWQGLQLASVRMGSLVAIVLAVNLFIKPLPKEQIIGGLLWWLAPLRWLGFPQERFAVRVVMTFNLIGEFQYEYDLFKRSGIKTAVLEDEAQTGEARFLSRLDLIGEFGAKLIKTVLDKAQQAAQTPIELPRRNTPPLYQWLFPMGLVAGFVWIKQLGVVI